MANRWHFADDLPNPHVSEFLSRNRLLLWMVHHEFILRRRVQGNASYEYYGWELKNG